MKILVISDVLPYPLDSGDRIRVYNLFKRIARRHELQIISLIYSLSEMDYIPPLQDIFQKVVTLYLPHRNKISHLSGLIKYILEGLPIGLYFKDHPSAKQIISESGESFPFDIYQVEHSSMARYDQYIPLKQNTKSVIDVYDVVFDQAQRIAKTTRNYYIKLRYLIDSHQMKRWEPNYLGRYDVCLCASEVDQRKLLTRNPLLNIKVIPNGVDTKAISLLEDKSADPNLLFIGKMYYQPSIDAVLFFLDSVFPLLVEKYPKAVFWIVGANPPSKLLERQSERVIFTGAVEDVKPYYEKCSVVVVPLLSGSGTRLKILEAMAYGKPVVSSLMGCEGLNVEDGEHLLIANTPEEWISKVHILLSQDAVRRKIIQNARDYVVANYDWDGIASQLESCYLELYEQELIHTDN